MYCSPVATLYTVTVGVPLARTCAPALETTTDAHINPSTRTDKAENLGCGMQTT
jgi:hypothetical protein